MPSIKEETNTYIDGKQPVRAPTFRVLTNGTVIDTAISARTKSLNCFQAGTFDVDFTLFGSKTYNLDWWHSQDAFDIEIQVGFQTGTTINYSTVIEGKADRITKTLEGGMVNVCGRDYTSYFIDTKIQDAFANMTSSQVVAMLVEKHGLTADVTSTNTLIGEFYNSVHDEISDGQTARSQTEWDLMTFLAQNEGFDLRVTGKTVYFGPPKAATGTPNWVVQYDVGKSPNPYVQTGISGNVISLHEIQNFTVKHTGLVVIVRSWNSQAGATYSATYPTKGASNSTEVTNQMVYSFPNLTKAQVLSKAQTLYNQLVQFEKQIEWEEVGSNLLMPGDQVSYQSANNTQTANPNLQSWYGTYYVDEISRHISFDGGYTMEVRAKNLPPSKEVAD